MNPTNAAPNPEQSDYTSSGLTSLSNHSTAAPPPVTKGETNFNKLFSLLQLDRSDHSESVAKGLKWKPPLTKFSIPSKPDLKHLAGQALTKLYQENRRETEQIRTALNTYLYGSSHEAPPNVDEVDSKIPKFSRAVHSQAPLWRHQDLLLNTISQCKSAGVLSDMAAEQRTLQGTLKEKERLLKERDDEWNTLKTEETQWKSSVFYKGYSACQSLRSGVSDWLDWGKGGVSSVSAFGGNLRETATSACISAASSVRSWTRYSDGISRTQGTGIDLGEKTSLSAT